MQSKGAIKLVAILLLFASLWQLSFTVVSNRQTKKAEKYAEQAVAAAVAADPTMSADDQDSLRIKANRFYLDSISSGRDSYKEIVYRLFEKHIEASAVQKTDYKTLLQQLAEQDGAAILEYRLVSEEGPEHNKSFTVAAFINNNEVGRGIAKTKKAAEMEAARVALNLFGVSV